jgi:hypothetical protein
MVDWSVQETVTNMINVATNQAMVKPALDETALQLMYINICDKVNLNKVE